MSTVSEQSLPPFIPLSEPCLKGNEWQYVQECLDSGWISSVGSFVTRFESEVSRYTGSRFAVATVNGTAALHAALMAAEIGAGDEVVTSTLTFIATANAIRYTGAHPVFIDAEPAHWQMDPDLLSKFLHDLCDWKNGQLFNRSTGRPVRAIMPVHVLGHPAELDEIVRLARKFNLRVIEDCAESLGAAYQGRKIGATSDSDIACFSFNGNKTITCGGGGMVVTSSQSVADRIRYLTTQAKNDPVEYIHNEIGYNYRLTNVLAAIGVAQLEKLDDYVASRRSIQAYYREHIRHPGIQWMQESSNSFSTCWLSTAVVDPERTGFSAVQLRNYLEASRIQARRLWQPMHLSPAHRDCQSVLTGVADSLFATAISLPSTPGLSPESLDRICRTVRNAVADSNLMRVA